jgi:ParB family chromosome partitioning protein
MKGSGKNINLTSYDDIFTTEEARIDAKREKIEEIPLSELFPFKNHPFKVLDDNRMLEITESIREHGVLVPCIARPRPEGGYELISGHRRRRACELAGLEAMPVIVRVIDDDRAIIDMVDSNLQRENILPSERAFAFKMKLEALKHQGLRTSCQIGTKFRADEKVAKDADESARTVQRFIRLTYLIPPMLDMVDERKIAFNPAVELSFLKPEEQEIVMASMENAVTSPSLSQAQRIKKLSQDGELTEAAVDKIFAEIKKPPLDMNFLRNPKIRKYFPKSYSDERVAETILKLVEMWHKQQMKKQEQSR